MEAKIDPYVTQAGIQIQRTTAAVDGALELARLSRALDRQRGVLLASSYEYPGRYKRYDLGFIDPPLVLEARGRSFELRALNGRGQLLLPACAAALRAAAPELELATVPDGLVHAPLAGPALDLRSEPDAHFPAPPCEPERACAAAPGRLDPTVAATVIRGRVPVADAAFAEEERTRALSVFTLLRALRDAFASAEDSVLGLYGAFGYDLVFQFEALRMQQPRAGARDLVLYLPDRVLRIDHERERAELHSYEFAFRGVSTHGLPRDTEPARFAPCADHQPGRDHAPGEYARGVERARRAFAAGDLFEVTPSQTFTRRCSAPPSAVFEALQRVNPAPYGFLINLGANAFLVGASPEMYVRVQGDRVETCPIAGTIARGSDALGDARQILSLLNSDKDAAELTMCTDVDRNDKARICVPGSVRVIGRRQIELYARLIHTVDHVEGRLRSGYDSLDALLTHLWAVTVTGAPKLAAMQFLEDCEQSPRGFYGGAVGAIGFDGSLNTGLALRTLQIEGGVVQVRVGATLHFDSDPAEEERECELKASVMLAVLDALGAQACAVASDAPRRQAAGTPRNPQPSAALRVLVVDHRDSFVHTLADYLRQCGAHVTTLRCGFGSEAYERLCPELVVLSPGPARPDAFGMRATFAELARRELPVFGVCLGLQGMVEYCGGRLAQLNAPVHGKASQVSRSDHALFRGLPERLRVGRYHSLYADPAHLPAELEVIAHAEDRTIMAIAHRERPWLAVQFHPESILSAEDRAGLTLVANVLALAAKRE